MSFEFRRHCRMTKTFLFLLITTLLTGGVLSAEHVWAGGVFHVFPPKIEDQIVPVARPIVLVSKSLVTVSEKTIEYRLEQTFYNDNDYELEGVFLFPYLGPSNDLEIKINDLSAPYELLSPTDMTSLLKKITLAGRDPTLLELGQNSNYVVRNVSISSRKQKNIKMKLTLQLPSEERETLNLLIPFIGERYSMTPVREMDIRIRFKSVRPVRNFFSSTNHFSIIRETPYRCLIQAGRNGQKVREDFQLLSSFSDKELDILSLTHRTGDGKGSFMVLISPPMNQTTTKEAEKDVVFLVDTSGSLKEGDFSIAKRIVELGLQRLKPTDRFNILTMSTKINRIFDKLVYATEENKMEASRNLIAINRGGGTDLYNGIINSVEQFSTRKRPSYLIIAGDGRPSIGITNPETILHDVNQFNRQKTRIFSMAIGTTAETVLLDRIAKAHRGSIIQISGDGDSDKMIKDFFSEVSQPILSDAHVDFTGSAVEDLEPKTLSDLFGNDPLSVFGRYNVSAQAETSMKFRAKMFGKSKTVVQDLSLPKENPENGFIETIWAMRRMAALIDREKLKGSDAELRETMVSLASEFGFLLPFGESSSGRRSSLDAKTGNLFWHYKNSTVPTDVQSETFKRIGIKKFRLLNGIWTDLNYKPGSPVYSIEFLSNVYMELIEQHPDLRPYLALGPEVIIAWKEKNFRITQNLN